MSSCSHISHQFSCRSKPIRLHLIGACLEFACFGDFALVFLLMGRRFRRSFLAVLLLPQVLAIVAARFGPERYFCWAPYDEITTYVLEVEIAGSALSQNEIHTRYRLPSFGRDNRSWANVPALIAHYERTRGAAQGARVTYRYRVNGGPARLWSWPDSAP